MPGAAGSGDADCMTNLSTIKSELQSRKLIRPRGDRMLAGVCAGIAQYLKVDPTVVRLATVALAVFTFGTAVLIYAAGWLLMPEEEEHYQTTVA